MSWAETLRRSIGLKPSFRRSGASRMSNIIFGSVLGVISGRYIFEEPIKDYWENEQAQSQAQVPVQAKQDSKK